MDALIQDLRYALRALRQGPGFAVVVVLTVALGVGANAAVFGVASALLLRPLPVRDPGSLLRVDALPPAGEPLAAAGMRTLPLAFPELADLKARTAGALDGLEGAWSTRARVEALDGVLQVRALAVTGGYFRLLGLSPAPGRGLTEADDRPGVDEVPVVIGRSLWRRLGSRADAVGGTLRLDGRVVRVVGVMDEGPVAMALDTPQVWMTAHAAAGLSPGTDLLRFRGNHNVRAVARLRPGTSRAAASAALGAVAASLTAADPESYGHFRVLLSPAGTAVGLARGPAEAERVGRAAFLLLLVTAGLLLAACANVANLMLARAAHRRRELAVRLSLGAGRGRLVRQLVTESVLLALLGGGAGLALAGAAMRAARALPRVAPASPVVDGRVLWFALALSLGAGVAFGLAPLAQVRSLRPASALAGGEAAPGRGRLAMRGGLVVAQVAFALVMLVGCGLLLRTVSNLLAVEPGFDAAHLLVARLDFTAPGRHGAPPAARLAALMDGVRAVPGVRAVGVGLYPPFTANRYMQQVDLKDAAGAVQPATFDYDVVDPGYFGAVGLGLRSGASFMPGAPPGGEVVVDRLLARRLWPRGDAVGRRLGTDGTAPLVVGVVESARYATPSADPEPTAYFAYPFLATGYVTLFVRAAGEPAALAEPVRSRLRAAEPSIPVPEVQTVDELRAGSIADARALRVFLAVMAALAVLITAVGLYGLMSYTVARRTREIGVRMSLGAPREHVLALVLGRSGRLSAAGVALGLAGALAASRVLASQLYGVTARDPLTYAAAAAVLAAVAAAATWLPARRAMRVDPVVALRAQ
jgi:putative ABC transport system permease protein